MNKKLFGMMAVASTAAMMAAWDAEAAFRVTAPPAEVRQQALMSLQSVGGTDEETVETTTRERPFAVDFEAFGVENPTNAYLLIVNEQSGNAVALEASDSSEAKLELPPLALAELEMQHLGASQSYRCMVMCATASGKDEMIGSRKLASSLGGVELPNFKYRSDDGDIRDTTASERRLVGYGLMRPSYTLADPDDLAAQARADALAEQNAYYVYEYELPNGTSMTYDEEMKIDDADTVSFQSANLTFNVTYSSSTPTAAKTATAYALKIWSASLQGTVPVTLSVTFTTLGDGILGCSYSPAAGMLNGVCYPESIYSQKVGADCSSNYDIRLEFNTNFSWYYGTDKNCGSKVDFVTIMLHEVCHGLGFYDSIISSTGGYGYGTGSYPVIYDTFLSYGGSRLTGMTGSSRRAAIVSDALYFDGPNAKAANGGARVKLFAPTTYMPGSSVSHWDTNVSFKNRTFMRYAYGGYPFHEITAIKAGAMKDLGWELVSNTPTKPAAPTGVSATKGMIVGEVDVTWNASSGATSYNVYRSTSASGTYTSVKTGLAACNYQDKSVSGTTTYYYKVAAVNSAGTSEQSSYDYGYAKAETVLDHIDVTGPATLNGGDYADYTCTAYYSDGSRKDVSTDGGCSWSLPYGASYATVSGRRLTAGYLTEQKTSTIRAGFGGKTAEKQVTILPKTLTVSFSPGDYGAASFTSRSYTVGSTYGTLPAISNVPMGYEFVGWFTAASGGTRITEESTVSGSVTRLYAHYGTVAVSSLRIVAPEFVESGESCELICRAEYVDGSSGAVIPAWGMLNGWAYGIISSDGVFTASQTAESRTVIVKASFDGLFTTHNLVVRPKMVTVAFDAHGGTVAEASRQYVVGAKYGSFPSAERDGYGFLGWFTAASGGTRMLESTTAAENVTTLHAQWRENPPALKDIWVSCDGGTASVTAGSTLALTCMAAYTNDFATTTNALNGADVAWATDDASAGDIGAGGMFTAGRVIESTTVTVTAGYKGAISPGFPVLVLPETVAVAFDAHGGTVAEAMREYVVGAAYGGFPATTPPSGAYRFDGWFTAADGGTRVTEATVCEKTVASLHARWADDVRLAGLRVEGGNVVTSGVPVSFTCHGIYSDGSEIPMSPAWAVADTAHGVMGQDGVFTASYVSVETAATIVAVSGGVTGALEVAIQPLEVSVHFDAGNGAVTPQRKSFIAGASYGELPTPTRSRHDFDGWFTGEGKTGERITSESIVSAEVGTLYAGWSPAALTLTGIRIEGVEAVTSGGEAQFSCKAIYSDGTEGSVVPVWSLAGGLDYASITLSGFFYAEEVETSRKVTVQAVYTDRGIRYEDQHEVTIVPTTLVVDPGAMSLESEAQRASILIDAWGSWRVAADADWITLDKTAGDGIDTVDFGVAANAGNEERIGTITVTCGGISAICVVKQYSPVPDEYVMVEFDTRISGQEATRRQYVKGRKFGYLPTPARQSYAFGGWWTLPDGQGSRVHAMTVVSDDTLSLHAHWTDVSVAYALNNALDWVEEAARPWAFDYAEAIDRKLSMTTPFLGNRESSSLTALVEGPGTISFYWRTSSEEFFDTLALSVDGRFVASISGETGWRTLSCPISGYGQHVVAWTYSKDGQGATGMDCAWLDMVTWMPDYSGSGAASIQSADGRSVPEAWLNAYGLDTRSQSLDDDADGDGMTNYDEFVAGTDPLDAESKFLAYIEFGDDGLPQIWAVPDLGDSDARTYVFEGKESLADEEWEPADADTHHFFRVRIETR